MSDQQPNQQRQSFEQRVGLKRLNPRWAKTEIFLGLAAMWCSFRPETTKEFVTDPDMVGLVSFLLFVLGGYLAMAGSRSDLYQSANKLTAFVVERIEEKR